VEAVGILVVEAVGIMVDMPRTLEEEVLPIFQDQGRV
jgi:hypothetical protein